MSSPKHTGSRGQTNSLHASPSPPAATNANAGAGDLHASQTSSTNQKLDRATTDIVEEIAPSVVQEHIQPIVREEQQTVVEREHHVVHEQQRVQPVTEHVELAEKHTHKILPVMEKQRTEEMTERSKRALEEQKQAYTSTTTQEPTQYSKIEAAAIGSDTTHHHVHETIQPVIQRDVVQKEVIHTTVPIHEIIHEKPVVHEATVEPTITMDAFMKKHGSVSGGTVVSREERPGTPVTMEGSHFDGKQHTSAIGTAGHPMHGPGKTPPPHAPGSGSTNAS